MSPKANGFPDSGPFAQGSAIGSDEPGSSSSNVIYPSSFTGGASANVTTPIPPSAGYAEAASGVGNTSQGNIMTDPIREEIDAKLTIVELRTENRFNELSSKIDRVVDSITALNSTMASELGSVKSELMIVKADNKYTRWTIILAVLAALGALWVTQSNLLSVLHFKLGCC